MDSKGVNDLVLLSSFLQSEQKEKTNDTLQHITDLLTGRSTDIEKLTRNIELSSTQLKDQQISDLQLKWDNVASPTHGLSHMVKLHTDYLRELTEQENKRIQDVLYYISETKRNSANPQDITAEVFHLAADHQKGCHNLV